MKIPHTLLSNRTLRVKFYDWCLTSNWSIELIILVCMVLIPALLGAIITISQTLTPSVNRFFSITSKGGSPFGYPLNHVFLSICMICLFWMFLVFLTDRLKIRKIEIAKEEMNLTINQQVTTVINKLEQENQKLNQSLNETSSKLTEYLKSENTQLQGRLENSNSVMIDFWKKENSVLQNKFDEAVNKLSSTIHNAPNSNIFIQYKKSLVLFFDDIQFLNSKIIRVTGDDFETESLLEIYNSFFQRALVFICTITKSFLKNKYSNYTANIMMYLPLSAETIDKLENLLDDQDNNVLYVDSNDGHNILGVLYATPNMMASIGKPRIFFNILLPVFSENEGNPRLPGAPKAAINGDAVVDTTDIRKKPFSALPNAMKKEAMEFFESKLGRHIKSFVSMKIPEVGKTLDELEITDTPNLQGVLNVDCDGDFLLGNDPAYRETYLALINPIINLMAPILKEYFLLLFEKKD